MDFAVRSHYNGYDFIGRPKKRKHLLWYSRVSVILLNQQDVPQQTVGHSFCALRLLFLMHGLVPSKQVFDVICGTSTGGILAMLFASEKQSLVNVSTLYDSLIVKIFRKDFLATPKLLLQQVREHHQKIST